MNNFPLDNAKLAWNEAGMPFSNEFNDLYFSNHNGLSETRHVFLAANQLPDRFHHHDRTTFVIGETGFGTGLNFLATMNAFLNLSSLGSSSLKLHFISFEKYPLTKEDLGQALRCWPELNELALQLIALWPSPLPGCHTLFFANGQIQLDLWLGDVQQMLPRLIRPEGGLIDVWYLDGFSPANNPAMWDQALFEGVAYLARPDSTLSTFTSAGFVRRGLIAAGFAMQKIKGHGCKREMLVGQRRS